MLADDSYDCLFLFEYSLFSSSTSSLDNGVIFSLTSLGSVSYTLFDLLLANGFLFLSEICLNSFSFVNSNRLVESFAFFVLDTLFTDDKPILMF